MRVLVTGATGFLGCETVARAVAAGHDVSALVGPHRDVHPGMFDSSVALRRGDLRSRGEWMSSLGAADVVVHLAAAAGGARGPQLASTVVGTENLLAALEAELPKRFVHISSLSVYDYHALRPGGRLDERAATEPDPSGRDAYTEAKLLQERLVREWCERHRVPCVILRPGAIVGPGKPWGYGAEATLGPFSIVLAPRARFRLVSLSNCADAIVAAAEAELDGVVALNVIDHQLPTNAEYFRLCKRAGAPTGTMVPVPWTVVDAVGRSLQFVSRSFLGGRLRLPELLDHRRQEARWKPLQYPNDRIESLLGWRSAQSIASTAESAATIEGPAKRA